MWKTQIFHDTKAAAVVQEFSFKNERDKGGKDVGQNEPTSLDSGIRRKLWTLIRVLV